MQDFEDNFWFCVEAWRKLHLFLAPFNYAWKEAIEGIHAVSGSLKRKK